MASTSNAATSKSYHLRSSQSTQSLPPPSDDEHLIKCYKCSGIYDETYLLEPKDKAQADEFMCPICEQYVDIRAMLAVPVRSSEHQQRQLTAMVQPNEKTTAHSSYKMSKPVKYRYTNINTVKAVYNHADAERYINGLAGIYNISDNAKGQDFVLCLVKSIHDQQPEFAYDHSFTNEHGERYYILVCVRTFTDRIEIGYSYQQIYDESTVGGAGAENGVLLSERKSEQWLKDKALESLRIHTYVVRSFHDNRYHSSVSMNYSGQNTPISYSDPAALPAASKKSEP